MDNEFFSTEELSKYLKVPLSTIYMLTERGKIPAAKIGRQWRYRRDIIDEWMERESKRNVSRQKIKSKQ